MHEHDHISLPPTPPPPLPYVMILYIYYQRGARCNIIENFGGREGEGERVISQCPMGDSREYLYVYVYVYLYVYLDI